VEGTMERVVDPASIKQAFRSLSQKLGYDKNLYDKMAEKYAANPTQSPVHRILINIAEQRQLIGLAVCIIISGLKFLIKMDSC